MLAPGQAFGNYRILSRVGVGGMGMVFLAEHPQIGKKVALKVIHRELAGNKEVVSRFLNEARAVNQIGNEHIVEIHDFGQTDDGQHFFIMEYLEGRTLAADLAKRPDGLAVSRGLHIGAQIASALGAAHDRDIIHRDLKPDNVMLIERLGDPDFVKLLDFGLAKFLTDSDARKLTAAGVVLGTPQYMSPEACESRPGLDRRSDIYSLGILLFQMLTGSLPFDGESMGEVLVKQVAHPPPAPRGFNADVPPSVEQVVLRCLAKDPDSRFQHMRELRDALLDPDSYLASSPPVVPVAGAEARTLYGAAAARRSKAAPAVRPDAATRMMDARDGGGAAAAATVMAMPAPDPIAPPGTQPEPAITGNSTAYMDEAAHRMFAGHMERNEPRPVENKTMQIGTPYGYKNHPPRRWPVVVAVLILLAAGGAAAALILSPDLFGAKADQHRADAAASAGAVAVTAPIDAAAAQPVPDASTEPAMTGATAAEIKLTTRPSGAQVFDQAGNLLGKTPLTLEMPIDGREVALTFRHPDAEERVKTFEPKRDAAFEVELPPKERTGPGSRSGGARRGGKKKNSKSDNLLRPTF